MAQTAVLHKILHVREQEKQDAQMEQLKAVDYFEKAAKKLYHALKTKEQAELGLEKYMKTEVTITVIKEQSVYIDTLNKKIVALQQQVQQARKEMELKQLKLTEAHVEVKKVEKMIEKREQLQFETEKKLEMIEMDEISIRQYTNHVQN
ncbi:flagellar export protein FliJ [Pseudogracilibacillus sp. SE30717A]|uniref:flagellar export protein FliJ n=1 Tax=Pseudogracilibacillus sp. SE30717A TaxID=3098293 RepID=UPI00300DFE4F